MKDEVLSLESYIPQVNVMKIRTIALFTSNVRFAHIHSAFLGAKHVD